MFYDLFACGLLLGGIFAALSILTYIECKQEQKRQQARYLARKRRVNKLVAKSRAMRRM